MNNLTKMKILKPAHEAFEAIVDPAKIGNFWFSSSSERWAPGKTVTLEYDIYNAVGEIRVKEVVENEKIVFNWGPVEDENQVTMTFNALDNETTIVEVEETGFDENDKDLVAKIVDNKEGWVYMLTCLKAYLESGVTHLREGMVK